MYKKEFSKLNQTYNKHLYSGFLGFLFKKNHELMEINLFELNNKKNIKVLEIGGGTMPHIKFLKHPFNSYYSIDTDENNELNNFYKKNFLTLYIKNIMEIKYHSLTTHLIEL